MNRTDGKNEIKLRLLKGVHFLLTVFLFSVAWVLFRYGKLFPAKPAELREIQGDNMK